MISYIEFWLAKALADIVIGIGIMASIFAGLVVIAICSKPTRRQQ